jgi:hypothetical protein
MFKIFSINGYLKILIAQINIMVTALNPLQYWATVKQCPQTTRHLKLRYYSFLPWKFAALCLENRHTMPNQSVSAIAFNNLY